MGGDEGTVISHRDLGALWTIASERMKSTKESDLDDIELGPNARTAKQSAGGANADAPPHPRTPPPPCPPARLHQPPPRASVQVHQQNPGRRRSSIAIAASAAVRVGRGHRKTLADAFAANFTLDMQDDFDADGLRRELGDN